MLRAEAGRDPHSRVLTELVGELATPSDASVSGWAAHDSTGVGSAASTTSVLARRRSEHARGPRRRSARSRPRAVAALLALQCPILDEEGAGLALRTSDGGGRCRRRRRRHPPPGMVTRPPGSSSFPQRSQVRYRCP